MSDHEAPNGEEQPSPLTVDYPAPRPAPPAWSDRFDLDDDCTADVEEGDDADVVTLRTERRTTTLRFRK